MSYSVYAYLTDAKKVAAVYGARDSILLNQLYQALKDDFVDLDESFPDQINDRNRSYIILQDIINGRISFPKVPFMYNYVYEKICEYYGQPIYNNEYVWQLDEQSTFMPIPLSKDFPYIISIESKLLYIKKKQYLLLEPRKGIGDYDYNEEREDLTYIFDEAINRDMDLVICVY